ncbi:MAG: nucleotidyltransferase domain-containing protein [Bacillota bacterium]|nr:MAG: nucleotidyltransferase domain-containing protein [Bacillota bacterium]
MRQLEARLGARTVAVFGSRARGDQLPTSDYDLVVVSAGFRGLDRLARDPGRGPTRQGPTHASRRPPPRTPCRSGLRRAGGRAARRAQARAAPKPGRRSA